jgi:hypothetical protein
VFGHAGFAVLANELLEVQGGLIEELILLFRAIHERSKALAEDSQKPHGSCLFNHELNRGGEAIPSLQLDGEPFSPIAG